MPGLLASLVHNVCRNEYIDNCAPLPLMPNLLSSLRSLFNIGIDLLSESNKDLIDQSCYEYLPYTCIVAKYDHSKFQDIDVADVGEEWQSAKWYLYYELSDK